MIMIDEFSDYVPLDLDDIEDFYNNVDDELEPICSVCHKPITFFDFANHGKCKECRGDS